MNQRNYTFPALPYSFWNCYTKAKVCSYSRNYYLTRETAETDTLTQPQPDKIADIMAQPKPNMSASKHGDDIHTIIYLERLIYSHDGKVLEDIIATTDLNTHTPSEAERLRVLALYDERNPDPHHQHWHRQVLGGGMVLLSKPAPFEPF